MYNTSGITENPIRNAHKVEIQYCSSDGWMGRSDTGPLKYKYQGSSIVEAVFQDLVSKYNLGKLNGQTTTVVFAGQSAGGRGAMFNIDYISNWFSLQKDLDVRLLGFLDSPYWIPMDPLHSYLVPLLEQARRIHVYANNSNVIREKCAQQYPDSQHYCMFGYYTMPFVETPSVMESATFDTFQLGSNIGKWDPSNPAILS